MGERFNLQQQFISTLGTATTLKIPTAEKSPGEQSLQTSSLKMLNEQPNGVLLLTCTC